MANSNGAGLTPESKVSLTVKEFIAVIIFLFSLAAPISVFLLVRENVSELKTGFNTISAKVFQDGERISKIEGQLIDFRTSICPPKISSGQ